MFRKLTTLLIWRWTTKKWFSLKALLLQRKSGSEEELENAELFVEPYSRCPHFVEVVYAEVPEENHNIQQGYAERTDFPQEESVDEVPVQEEAVDQVPVQEQAVDQGPAQEEAVDYMICGTLLLEPERKIDLV